ncbi:hypothetical protein BUE80_DR009053 [Diplocarpon rosae]|nr:hypothetical protein BUE80_DR009053 [Diplocarpon rosae]
MQQQHHPHHAQQGPAPPHHLQQSRPSSIVHQHHQQQQQQQVPPQSQHSNPYPSSHGLPQYAQSAPGAGGQHPQELPYYTQPSHPSPYSTPSANGTYSSAAPETPDIMAAAQMSRPYPPHLLPHAAVELAGVARHDGQPEAEDGTPRAADLAPGGAPGPPPQQPPPPQQHPANGPPMNQNTVPGAGGSGVNPNAAPGPIPATTPLVVRQDNNGVQWIAFEYSRDRVKMEYTIRCDVESVNVDTLSPEFKTENCVYPRACCSKDQYRGNRLVYENECNTVGWALAELNPCLRGKRGLIQRAVDSWRNSNQDPRLRSRRVRRMAKINTRKAVQSTTTHSPHMAGPSGPTGMPPTGNMGPSAGSMGKPSLSGMGAAQLHHHHNHPDGSTGGGGDDVDVMSCRESALFPYLCYDTLVFFLVFFFLPYFCSMCLSSFLPLLCLRVVIYLWSGKGLTILVAAALLGEREEEGEKGGGGGGGEWTQRRVSGRGAAPPSPPSPSRRATRLGPAARRRAGGARVLGICGRLPAPAVPPKAARGPPRQPPPRPPPPLSVRAHTNSHARPRGHDEMDEEERRNLFGDIPEAKKRKFILVDDPGKGGRVRVRVTLDTVVTDEIPDSFRKSNSPAAVARGSRFFEAGDEDDSGGAPEEGRGLGRGRAGPGTGKQMVPIQLADGGEAEIAIPRMRKSWRRKEVTLNDLGYRMTWHQSRVFADKTVFLQKASGAPQ